MNPQIEAKLRKEISLVNFHLARAEFLDDKINQLENNKYFIPAGESIQTLGDLFKLQDSKLSNQGAFLLACNLINDITQEAGPLTNLELFQFLAIDNDFNLYYHQDRVGILRKQLNDSQ